MKEGEWTKEPPTSEYTYYWLWHKFLSRPTMIRYAGMTPYGRAYHVMDYDGDVYYDPQIGDIVYDQWIMPVRIPSKPEGCEEV